MLIRPLPNELLIRLAKIQKIQQRKIKKQLKSSQRKEMKGNEEVLEKQSEKGGAE